MTVAPSMGASESSVTPSDDMGSAASSEEFPLQEPRLPGSAETPAIEIPLKNSKIKRFSLRSIAKPFTKFNTKANTKQINSQNNVLKSARKSLEGKRESRETRRVSFSPSTDEAKEARDEPILSAIAVTDYSEHSKRKSKLKASDIKRSSSYNDSIGRQGNLPARKRAVSFTWDKKGVHISPGAALEAKQVRDKARMSKPRITKQQAIAARHARALEQIINAGASLDIDSVESLKAKRDKKTGGKLDKTKLQMIPAISPRKVLSLKRALLDSEMANGIIGELRFMQLDERTVAPPVVQAEASTLLETVLENADEQPRRKVRPAPIKAICLDCSEEEADRRQRQLLLSAASKTADETKPLLTEGEAAAITTAAAASVVGYWGLGGLFKAKETVSQTTTITDSQGHQLSKTTVTNVKTPASEAVKYAKEIESDVANADIVETIADATRLSVVALKEVQPLAGTVAEAMEGFILPEDKHLPIVEMVVEKTPTVPGLLSGVSPISLIMNPVSGAASLGMTQSGTFDALGSLSGLAVQAANGGAEGMEEIRPPLDRMAIFIRWWGFEMTLPHSSMSYLSTVQSVSASFLTFLQTMVVTGGVPELLPFVRYFSSFMDMEFGAIKSQDRGHGVVIAATWLMPMALVPRPWDYPTTPASPPPPSPPIDPASKSPSMPARLSSFQSRSASSKRSPSPSSISSQERHAEVNREAGIASARNESINNAQSGGSSLLNQAPSLDVLASLEEVPEVASIRVKT